MKDTNKSESEIVIENLMALAEDDFYIKSHLAQIMADPESHTELYPHESTEHFDDEPEYSSIKLFQDDKNISFISDFFQSDKIYFKTDVEVNGLVVFKENNTNWKKVYLKEKLLDLALDLFTGSDLGEHRASHVYCFFYKTAEKLLERRGRLLELEPEVDWIKMGATGQMYESKHPLTEEFFKMHEIGPFAFSGDHRGPKPWMLALFISCGSLILIGLVIVGIICIVKAVRRSKTRALKKKGETVKTEPVKSSDQKEFQQMVPSPRNPLVNDRYAMPLGEQDQNVVYKFNNEDSKKAKPNGNKNSEGNSDSDSDRDIIINQKDLENVNEPKRTADANENQPEAIQPKHWGKIEDRVESDFDPANFETQPDGEHENLVPQLNSSKIKMKQLKRHLKGGSKGELGGNGRESMNSRKSSGDNQQDISQIR